ncbi:unnamed protein product [Linum trigynum]|uniref:Uncharacterized protein n=1 Tax=Linum trigynum TaxID=586398 RepID=A0AAV2F376_9ROSI
MVRARRVSDRSERYSFFFSLDWSAGPLLVLVHRRLISSSLILCESQGSSANLEATIEHLQNAEKQSRLASEVAATRQAVWSSASRLRTGSR